MALEPHSPAAFEFVELVARAYASLMQSALADSETGLGGKFFFAGELDNEGRALVVAANIAGAASLVASADRAAQKQAIHDGVADFLVNSLDEALRILKNQLRKRQTVAVCLGLATGVVDRGMRERGVLPDLLRSEVEGAQRVDAAVAPVLLTWSVASAPAHWLPKLDAIGLECLDAGAWSARRWLRLAPRYLGRMAQGMRLLACDRDFASRFIEQVRLKVDRGEIPAGIEIRSHDRGQQNTYRFVPGNPSGATDSGLANDISEEQ